MKATKGEFDPFTADVQLGEVPPRALGIPYSDGSDLIGDDMGAGGHRALTRERGCGMFVNGGERA